MITNTPHVHIIDVSLFDLKHLKRFAGLFPVPAEVMGALALRGATFVPNPFHFPGHSFTRYQPRVS
jgi:hypothetical protein